VVLGLLLAGPGSGQTGIPAHPGILRFAEPLFEPPTPESHLFELPGGAVAFLAEDHTLPLVDVAVALRVGSFVDPPDKSGLASLTGSLLRRAGAADMPADVFDNRAAHLGAKLDSFAGITRGGASLNVTRWGLEEGLELFFAMLREPRFDDERVQATLRTLAENMRRRNESPMDLLEREWEWLLWGEEHFSTRPVTSLSLGAISRDDMRALHRRYWHPENLVFAISGAVTREEILPLLTRHMESWTPAEDAVTPDWPPPRPTHRPASGPYLIEKDVPQAKVMLGHLAERDPTRADASGWEEREVAALMVMNEILGGSGAISRIAGRLRTAEGLVYRASASFDTGELWSGELRIFFDTGNVNVARAVGLCMEEIRRLQSRPAHPQELAVAKETLLAGIRQSFDTAEGVAGYLAEDHLMGRPRDYWSRRYELIRQITAEEVQVAAARHLRPADLIVLAVGRGLQIGLPTGGRKAQLERLTGRDLVQLPLRDPLTLTAPGDQP
jgi:predicted Zn-dependent peptidase